MRPDLRWPLATLLVFAVPAFAAEPVDREEASRMPGEAVRELAAADAIRAWPEASREAAQRVIDRYGQPDERTDTQLIWRENGPWKRTIVHRDGVAHSFPTPHQDVLEQVIDYAVPPEYADDLALFDGSLHVRRTAGELVAACDSEAMNFLAINLADDIVRGEKSVAEARIEYGRTVVQHMAGESPDLTQGLQFQLASGRTAFRDEAIIRDNRVTTAGIDEPALQPVDLEKEVEEEQPGLRPTTRERPAPEPAPELEDRTETPRTDEPRIEEEPTEGAPIEEERVEPY